VDHDKLAYDIEERGQKIIGKNALYIEDGIQDVYALLLIKNHHL
jgi:hypothetical protein